MIGHRLERARKAAGLSMRDLAAVVGVSANMIKKYEHDDSMPSSGVLVKIAKALDVRSEYFFRPTVVELARVEYRKRSSTPTKLLRKIEADVLDQAERWQELANLWPELPVPKFELPKGLPERINHYDDIESVAEAVRDFWDLGRSPIPDLIDALESHGILVIVTEVEVGANFDGLQATVAKQPVIVVSKGWSGDRQRFTLAHELGHLLLHRRLTNELDEERACHRFSSAFLLPAESLRNQLGSTRHNLEPRELYLLKHEFGLSMQSCLYRAADLGIISDKLRQQMFVFFSKKGWRKQEPGKAYPLEVTQLFEQLVYRSLGEGIVGESKAAELMGMPLMHFHQARKLEVSGAVAHQ
jgi:Zn-dependent peptidase ImmA (M78 family)/transcriptional regulator with XRE-family HTH domain